jgi:FxsC-like protein
MKDYWFFLSYARRDAIGREYLKRFYEELTLEVASKAGLDSRLKAEDIGFFDEIGVEVGDRWPVTMESALQKSRAFVCLFSRGYFNSEYCGKELQVFVARLDAYAAANSLDKPPLIIPVLWDGPHAIPRNLPKVVSDVQYTHDKFGKTYSEEGLGYIMRLEKHKDDYQEFLMRFGEKLVDVGKSFSLPPLSALPPLTDVKSIFHLGSGSADPPRTPDSAGPRFVQFVYVAGNRDAFEAHPLRHKLEYYGPDGGMDWHPYLPDVPDEVCMLAQDVASAEKLRYEVLPLGNDVIRQIAEAERRNKVVAIIVDTWTLTLQPYHTFMRDYDSHSFLNCVVLVPWNNNDNETVASRSDLEDKLRETFQNRAFLEDPTFLDRIGSYDELKKELCTALNKARMRIIDRTELIKRAGSDHAMPKPIVTGPGGTLYDGRVNG